jgi:hypothetical protein
MDHLQLLCWHACIFGVTAVELPAHSAHYGSYGFAFLKLTPRCLLHDPDTFNAEDSRKMYVWRKTLAREQL